MKRLFSLLLAAALAAPLIGCEAQGRIDDDDDHRGSRGRAVGHDRHHHGDNDGVDVRAKSSVDTGGTDVRAKGRVDVD